MLCSLPVKLCLLLLFHPAPECSLCLFKVSKTIRKRGGNEKKMEKVKGRSERTVPDRIQAPLFNLTSKTFSWEAVLPFAFSACCQISASFELCLKGLLREQKWWASHAIPFLLIASWVGWGEDIAAPHCNTAATTTTFQAAAVLQDILLWKWKKTTYWAILGTKLKLQHCKENLCVSNKRYSLQRGNFSWQGTLAWILSCPCMSWELAFLPSSQKQSRIQPEVNHMEARGHNKQMLWGATGAFVSTL